MNHRMRPRMFYAAMQAEDLPDWKSDLNADIVYLISSEKTEFQRLFELAPKIAQLTQGEFLDLERKLCDKWPKFPKKDFRERIKAERQAQAAGGVSERRAGYDLRLAAVDGSG